MNSLYSLLGNSATARVKRARRIALDGLSHALRASNPSALLAGRVKLKGDVLEVDGLRFRLSRYEHVYIVGAGKASGRMAEFMESLLGEHLTGGVVNILRGTSNRFKVRRILLNEAGHPTPDEGGLSGALKIASMVDSAGEGDLVICLLSGGGSSMLPLPRGEVSIGDKAEIARKLMLAGADISELNTVRKHLSHIKGGWLAKRAYPAEVLSLILSDVVGDPLDVIASGPTAPDESSFTDAFKVLQKYGLWDSAPHAVRNLISKGLNGLEVETPKPGDPCFKKVHNLIVGCNRSICSSLTDFYRNRSINVMHLTSFMEGEAREAGLFYAALLREVAESDRPIPRPCVLILGGETTVTVKGDGRGGRNQEAMLSASIKLRGIDGVACLSFGTDGLDGPTDAAGAIVDGFTYGRALEKGLKPEEYLTRNDSYRFFRKLEDLVITGPTGTNVNDITLLVAVR
ncbi:MAG: glycerate kinase type-2 family protein [Candidatus Bathyarchaeia archaeon]